MSDRKGFHSLLFSFVWLVGTAFFAASAQAETLLQEQGVLEQGDEVLPSDNSLADLYTFEGQAGQQIKITLESTEFNAYLILVDSELNKIGENDDANQGTQNAEIVLTLPTSGPYAVIVNGQDQTDRGRYTLTVSSGTASTSTSPSAVPQSAQAEAPTPSVGTSECAGITGDYANSRPIQQATLESRSGGYTLRFTDVFEGQPQAVVWQLDNDLIIQEAQTDGGSWNLTSYNQSDPVSIQPDGAFNIHMMVSSRSVCTFSGTLKFLGDVQTQLFPGTVP